MQTLLLLAAVCTLLFYLYSALEMAFGSRTIAKLEDIPPLTSSDQPKVSVVISACNEERGIEQGYGATEQCGVGELPRTGYA